MTDSLWPDDIIGQIRKTPISLMKEQAAALGEKTHQLITGTITSNSNADQFYHTLLLSVPALNNYRYELFHIQHDITLYPVMATWKNSVARLMDEAQFMDYMRKVFADTTTRNIITSLYSQVQK
jgi:nicotinamide mononucleotide adenylyltransferase